MSEIQPFGENLSGSNHDIDLSSSEILIGSLSVGSFLGLGVAEALNDRIATLAFATVCIASYLGCVRRVIFHKDPGINNVV
jgi:hypothetical protein